MMIPAPFHIKKRRSFVHKTGKSPQTKSVNIENGDKVVEQPSSHQKNPNAESEKTRNINTPSLKVCKKWLIGELKRVKKENLLLRSHLDSSGGSQLVQCKQKLAQTQQKKSALKMKYKALVHIHKSSLVELYNLAVAESNALKNDISLLGNVIQRFSTELTRYENQTEATRKEPTKENSAIKVTKLRNLSEVHIFTPLMRAYEALLSDRTDLIDQYKQEGSKLRKMITSLEDENQALRKSLAAAESNNAKNAHKIESLTINRDLFAEQNEVLIHKVNLFNTSLNLLLSKYETLEIRNLQLSRRNNSLTRAARLSQVQNLNPYQAENNRAQNLNQSRAANVSQSTGKCVENEPPNNVTFGQDFSVMSDNKTRLQSLEMKIAETSSLSKKLFGDNETEMAPIEDNVTNVQQNIQVEASKTSQLQREILLLKERNAMLLERNVGEHIECISKRVHQSIVQHLHDMFDELRRKYRESQERERQSVKNYQEREGRSMKNYQEREEQRMDGKYQDIKEKKREKMEMIEEVNESEISKKDKKRDPKHIAYTEHKQYQRMEASACQHSKQREDTNSTKNQETKQTTIEKQTFNEYKMVKKEAHLVNNGDQLSFMSEKEGDKLGELLLAPEKTQPSQNHNLNQSHRKPRIVYKNEHISKVKEKNIRLCRMLDKKTDEIRKEEVRKLRQVKYEDNSRSYLRQESQWRKGDGEQKGQTRKENQNCEDNTGTFGAISETMGAMSETYGAISETYAVISKTINNEEIKQHWTVQEKNPEDQAMQWIHPVAIKHELNATQNKDLKQSKQTHEEQYPQIAAEYHQDLKEIKDKNSSQYQDSQQKMEQDRCKERDQHQELYQQIEHQFTQINKDNRDTIDMQKKQYQQQKEAEKLIRHRPIQATKPRKEILESSIKTNQKGTKKEMVQQTVRQNEFDERFKTRKDMARRQEHYDDVTEEFKEGQVKAKESIKGQKELMEGVKGRQKEMAQDPKESESSEQLVMYGRTRF